VYFSSFLRACLMVLLMVAVGCGPRIMPSVTTEVKDSVWTKEIVRIDTVHIPGDTIILRTVIECDPVTNKPKPAKVRVKSDRGAVDLDINNKGEIVAKGITFDLWKQIELRDKEIHRLRSEKRKETHVVTKYKTRQIDVFCRWITAILFLLLIGYAALKYFKTSIPWIRI
jgi:adenine specific DNA methylase Mod